MAQADKKPSRAEELLTLKLAAMQQERDFWCEQARSFQNQLQVVLRGQASILDQMAHSAVCPADVHDEIKRMGEELRRPLTTAGAAAALAAAARVGTQGRFTRTYRGDDPALEDR